MNNNNIKSVRPIHGILAPDGGLLADLDARHRASHWQENPPQIEMGKLLEEIGWNRIDFIKCDIEGAEFELFMRKNDWLEKVDRIAMEVHTEYGDVNQLASFLCDNGFEVILTDLDMRPVNHLSEKFGYLYAIKDSSSQNANK